MNDDKAKAPYNCKFCGTPSWIDPSDQEQPPDYCHESDHGCQDGYEHEFICMQAESFLEDFALLVAKHINAARNALSGDYDESLLLAMMQERTSVFNPYVQRIVAESCR